MTSKILAEGLPDRIREYLKTADLNDCSWKTLSQEFGAPPWAIQYRLAKSNTSWHRLKAEEKTRRLDELLQSPGKWNGPRAAEICGFAEVNSFYRFFTNVMGMNFKDWQARRAQDILFDPKPSAG